MKKYRKIKLLTLSSLLAISVSGCFVATSCSNTNKTNSDINGSISNGVDISTLPWYKDSSFSSKD